MSRAKTNHKTSSIKIVYSIILFLVLFVQIIAQNDEIEFSHISGNDGLSVSTVTRIIQDDKGFMWFGTYNGLNRYDGYNFKIYLPDPDDPNSISNHSIWALQCDKEGYIWTGALDGLNKFDTKTEKFFTYKYNPKLSGSISSNYIIDILEDRSGILWIATLNGLNKYNREKDRFSSIKLVSDRLNPDSLNSIMCITEDYDGTLWLGTWNGLTHMEKDGTIINKYFNESKTSKSIDYRKISVVFIDSNKNLWVGTTSMGLLKYNRQNDNFIQHLSNEKDPATISQNNINSIYQDRENRLWIGTRKGLNIFDINSGKFQRILNNPQKPSSIINNEIYSIYGDNTGLLWIGSAGGVSKYYQTKNKFYYYSEYEKDPTKKMSSNRIHSLYLDNDKNIWAGTFEGLDEINPGNNSISHFRNKPGDRNSLNNNFIMSVLRDHSGIVWAGTYNGGLNRYNPTTGQYKYYKFDITDGYSLSNNCVVSLCEVDDTTLWVGTWFGLNRFNKKTEKFYRFNSSNTNPNSLNNHLIWAIHKDSDGIIWLGTDGGGVNRLDPKNNTFTHFTRESIGAHKISENRVFSIFESNDGLLWFASSNGLNVYDRKADKIKIYKTENGLPGNSISAVAEDNKGFIWITTDKGLSKFNRQTETFTNYTRRNGLKELEFDNNVSTVSNNGTLYFGCRRGLLYFNPEDVIDDSLNAKIVFTDLKLFNNSVPISSDNNSILKESITTINRITLPYNSDVFTIEFALLDYYNVKSNSFEYKLLGFDTNWNAVGSRNSATYTNLPPGDYIFAVKAFNRDGVKNLKETELLITILPAFYQTWWFKAGIAALLVFLTLLIINTRTKKIKTQNKILEGHVAERTKDLDQTISKLSLEIVERKRAEEKVYKSLEEKEILLKEIHHRVKNNLQVISSLLFLQSTSLKDAETIDLFKDSQDRIRCMALIHEKLYQSRNFAEISFNDYVVSLIEDLEHSYRKKNFQIKTNLNVDNISLSLDTAMSCGLIVNELITNIFKYAFPQDWLNKQPVDFTCNVNVKAQKEDVNKFLLEISDNGIGMPENLDIQNSESLGIKLVNSLADQLNGIIEIEINNGTKFKILFEDLI